MREFCRRQRLGGDEFVVLLTELDAAEAKAASQAESVAEKILAAIQSPFKVHDEEFQCTCSIGVSLFQQNLETTDRTGADPARLKLELTEGVVLDNIQATIDKMHALKAMGVGFSMDDFGTGYSSLTYLKRLPIDMLKIDGSFVRDVVVDKNDAVIVQTMLGMARHLGIQVIAEGVETAEQLEFLKAHGFRNFQGYLFSRPLPLAEFERHLADPSGLFDRPSGVVTVATA